MKTDHTQKSGLRGDRRDKRKSPGALFVSLAALVWLSLLGCDPTVLWTRFQEETESIFVDVLSPVQESAEGSGDLILFGDFAEVNDQEKGNIAWLDGNGTLVEGFSIATDGPVYDAVLLERDGQLVLVVGGSFDNVIADGASTPRSGLAAVTLAGEVLDVLNITLGTGTATVPEVRALWADRSGGLWIGGDFSGADPDGNGVNASYRNLFRVELADGSVDTEVTPQPDGMVHDIVGGQDLLGHEQIMAVGSFSQVADASSPSGADSPLAVVFERDADSGWDVAHRTVTGLGGSITDAVLYAAAFNQGLDKRISYLVAGRISDTASGTATDDPSRIADLRLDYGTDPATLVPVDGDNDFGGHNQPRVNPGTTYSGPVWDIESSTAGTYVFVGEFNTISEAGQSTAYDPTGDVAISGIAAGNPTATGGIDTSTVPLLPQLDNADNDYATGDPNGERKTLVRVGSYWYLSVTDNAVFLPQVLTEFDEPTRFENTGWLRFDRDWNLDDEYDPDIDETTAADSGPGIVYEAVVVLPSWRP